MKNSFHKMFENAGYNYSLTILAVGGACIPFADGFGIQIFQKIGCYIICFGLLSFIPIFVIKRSNSAFKDHPEEIKISTNNRHTHMIRLAGTSDLDDLYQHYQIMFDDDIITKEEFSSWIVKNNEICRKITRLTRKNGTISEKIVGFFDIEPITKNLYQKIIDPTSKGEIGIGVSQIVPKDESTNYFYIGSLGTTSKNIKDRAAVLLGVLQRISAINSLQKMIIITKPVTEDGRRICEHYGFKQIAGVNRNVWILRIAKGELNLNSIGISKIIDPI